MPTSPNSRLRFSFAETMGYWFGFVIALVVLIFSPWTFVKFDLPKIATLYVACGISLCLWAYRVDVTRSLLWTWNRYWTLALFGLGVIAISTAASVDQQTSLVGQYFRFDQGLLYYLALLILAWTAAVLCGPTQRLTTLRLAAGAIVLSATYAAVQWLGWDFKSFNIHAYRSTATFGEPSNQAGMLAMGLPLLLFFLLGASRLQNKVLLVLALSLTWWGLLATYSRGGYLAAAVGCLIVALAALLADLSRRSTLKWLGGTATLLGVIAAVFFAKPIPEGESFLERETGNIRLEIWKTVPQLVAESPLLGSGPETFGYVFPAVRPNALNLISGSDQSADRAHNELLNTWATLGTLGLVTYLLLFGVAFYSLLRSARGERERWLAVGLAIALLASYGIHVFFAFSHVGMHLLLIGGVLLATGRENNVKASPLGRLSALGLLGVASLVLLVISVTVLQQLRADMAYSRAEKLFQTKTYALAQPWFDQAVQGWFWKDTYLRASARNQVKRIIERTTGGSAASQDSIDAVLEMVTRTREKHSPNSLNEKLELEVSYALGAFRPELITSGLALATKLRQDYPTYLPYYEYEALFWSTSGESDRARQTLESALTLNPDYPPALVNLMLLAAQQGDMTTAKAYAARVLSSDPDHTQAQQISAM